MLRAPVLVGSSLVLLLAPLVAQHQRVARPVVRLRLENAKLFTETDYAPLFRGLGELLAERFGIEGEAQRARLDELWGKLRWPVEVVVILERESLAPIVGIWMPEGTPPLLGALTELGVAGTDAATSEVAFDGAAFASVTLAVPKSPTQLVACEGAHGGRRLLLLGAAGALAPAESLALFVRSCARVTPSQRALDDEARGGDIGWVIDSQAIGPAAVGLGFQDAVMKFLLGSQFRGISGRVRVADGKIAIDVYADVRPSVGWVGSVLHREPRAPTLTAWIPPGTTEYVTLDPSIAGVVRLLRGFGMFVAPKGAELHESLSWLGEIDVLQYLDTHFTGEVVAATEVGIETQFAKLQNVEGFALGFGAYDGHRLLAETRAAVNGGADGEGNLTRLDETPAQGPGVYTLTRGGEPSLYVAAVRDAVFVSGADHAGAAMLRKILATGGRGAARARDGSAIPAGQPCTMLGRGQVMRHLTKALEELGVDAGRGLRLSELLREFLARHDGVAAWRLVIDQSGARLHVDL